jgi:hypothetical protein
VAINFCEAKENVIKEANSIDELRHNKKENCESVAKPFAKQNQTTC